MSYPRRYHWLGLAALLVIISVALFPPVTLLGKTQAVGYAICHQLPGHTFFVDGVPLPLCARCTGIYLGFLAGLGGMLLLGRQYAIDLPPTPILLSLVMFVLIMAFDGLNSLLGSLPMLPQFYPSQNWLRLVTGTFHGLAISVIAYPVLSISLWPQPVTQPRAVIETVGEFAAFLLVGAMIVGVVLWRPPVLLYPLAVLSTLGVLLMVSLINMVLVLVVTRQEATIDTWRGLLLPGVMAVALSFLMLGGMGWLRQLITT